MLVGVITTRDLILHPVSVFSIQGVWGFIRILRKALSRDKYRFLDILWRDDVRRNHQNA